MKQNNFSNKNLIHKIFNCNNRKWLCGA